jgi:hypothetical protein
MHFWAKNTFLHHFLPREAATKAAGSAQHASSPRAEPGWRVGPIPEAGTEKEHKMPHMGVDLVKS